MIRKSVLGILLVAFVVAVSGCNTKSTARNDMSIKSSPEIDPKTGKKSKTFEATLEDPPRK